MIFNSLIFALFMPVMFIVYWLVLGRSHRAQNVWILLMSYLFYGWWDWRFCFLLGGVTTITYFCARIRNRRKLWTTVAVAVNLGTLIIFKYFNFFSKGLMGIFNVLGWAVDWFSIDVLLPVGISFYIFQAVGYLMDVYRGDIPPCRNFLVFACFISFFPQLVAGPIERAEKLIPQFSRPRQWNYGRAVEGMRLILWGLFKKCAVADLLGVLVDPLWNPWTTSLSAGASFTALIAFPIQLYADFSGYCDIARGLAKLLGFELMVNFSYPYFSRNVIEFWHRWHISLMEWFTRYVYIPMGGSRKGNRYLHIMIVFLLSGLWHGAAMSFVVWGGLCGIFYAASVAMRLPRYRPADTPPGGRRDAAAMALTFILYALPCVFFRAPGFDAALSAFRIIGWQPWLALLVALGFVKVVSLWPRGFNFTAIFILVSIGGAVLALLWPVTFLKSVIVRVGMLTALLMFMAEWRGRDKSFALAVMPRRRWVRYAAYIGLYLITMSAAADRGMPFLYFQF